MGYTQYLNVKQNEVIKDEFEKALLFIRKIIGENKTILANWEGIEGSRPTIFGPGISFNGIEGNSHESFNLPTDFKKLEDFYFCKTAGKPYDLIVAASYIILGNCKGFEFSSDGDFSELKDALELAKKATDLPLKLGFEVEEPIKEEPIKEEKPIQLNFTLEELEQAEKLLIKIAALKKQLA